MQNFFVNKRQLVASHTLCVWRMWIDIALTLVLLTGIPRTGIAVSKDMDEEAGTSQTVKQQARTKWREGNIQYNLGHYTDAAKLYEAAYTLVQDPAFLFNLAQCYRMDGKLEQALDRYRAFLRTSAEDTQEREVAQKFIEELKRKSEEKAASAEPSAAPLKLAPAEAPSPSSSAQRVPIPTVVASSSAAQPSADIATSNPLPLAVLPTSSSQSQSPPMALLPRVSSENARTGSLPTLDLTTPATPGLPSKSVTPSKAIWWWLGASAIVATGVTVALWFYMRSNGDSCGGTSLPCLEVR